METSIEKIEATLQTGPRLREELDRKVDLAGNLGLRAFLHRHKTISLNLDKATRASPSEAELVHAGQPSNPSTPALTRGGRAV